MATPSSRGGKNSLAWREFHHKPVYTALGITYRMLDRWTDFGLVEVESFKQHTHIPATGSGSCRIYRYPDILQLALVRELHLYQKELSEIKDDLSDPPEDYLSWGSLIAAYRPSSDGKIFSAVGVRGEALDLIRDPEELLGALALDVSCVHVNLGLLRTETDEALVRVLPTA